MGDEVGDEDVVGGDTAGGDVAKGSPGAGERVGGDVMGVKGSEGSGIVGDCVGFLVGLFAGLFVGFFVGLIVGFFVGLLVTGGGGKIGSVGDFVGAEVPRGGERVGADVTRGVKGGVEDDVGLSVGTLVGWVGTESSIQFVLHLLGQLAVIRSRNSSCVTMSSGRRLSDISAFNSWRQLIVGVGSLK